MARKRRMNRDEPLHDFTAGPAVAPRDNPRIRTFEVFYQGCPTLYSIRLHVPVVDGVYQAYLGSEPLVRERRHLHIDDALEQIAEHMDYLCAHDHGHPEALVDRTKKAVQPATAARHAGVFAGITEAVCAEAGVPVEHVICDGVPKNE